MKNLLGVVIMSGFFLVVAGLIIAFAPERINSGKIVQKVYHPAYTEVQAQYGHAPNGERFRSGTIPVYHPERYEIIIEGKDSKGKKVRNTVVVPPHEYRELRKGATYFREEPELPVAQPRVVDGPSPVRPLFRDEEPKAERG